MKRITIIYKKSKPFTLIDNDDTDLKIYTKELTKIMEFSKVCILETTSGNAIIKPSEISSIFIEEESSDKKETIKPIFSTEDVIKDM